MTNYEIWQAVLAEFELKISKPNFTTWFRNTGISKFDAGSVLVCVPNAFTKSWLERKYHSDIVKSLERITAKPVKKIEYMVENIKNLQEKECFPSSENKIPDSTNAPSFPPPVISSFFRAKSPVNVFGLNQKYSFTSFIVGKGNELAHAAAQAVANRPGETYNPLFIYGGVGLGKTHLLQAVGNQMLEKNQNTKILYVSSEKFTNDFVSSIKEGRGREFKERYRSVDLLLIDDIQFIGGKEQTQEEFFHTFNELHQQGKQVVMTSDRPPKAIPSLEDRLRSRFEWGMIVDVAAPDLETRVAILQSKCQEKNFFLPPDIIDTVANNVQNNIRELEGALNKIIAHLQLKNLEPKKEIIEEIISTLTGHNMGRSTTPKEIVLTVAEFFSITTNDLTGKSREKKLSFPRQIAMFLLRRELGLSFPAIGGELGGRDHTTAMHANSKIEKEMENNAKLKQDLENIKQKLYSLTA